MACLQQVSRPLPRDAKKSRPRRRAADFVSSCQSYSTAFSFELLSGSTQFVIPPVRATKRVIGNCGSQSTSRPLKLPVMLAARNPAKAPSSRWTPTPPLAVIVGPPKAAEALPRSLTPSPLLPLTVPPLRFRPLPPASMPTPLLLKLELSDSK